MIIQSCGKSRGFEQYLALKKFLVSLGFNFNVYVEKTEQLIRKCENYSF